MNTIGKKIKKLRNDRKMTQQELADEIGVSESTVSLYESDTRKPSFKALSRIAKVFDVTEAFFLNAEESNNGEIKNENIRMAARNMEKLSDADVQTINTLIKSLLKTAKEGE
jgi:transcriptional regulator with XRE-family HTH domain